MANISVLPNTEIQSTKKRHQHKRVKVSKSVHLGRVLAVVKQLSPKELQLLEPWFRSRQESNEIRRTKTMPESVSGPPTTIDGAASAAKRPNRRIAR